MELSRDFKLNDYVISEKVSSTKEFIVYKALKNGEHDVLVCELYPEDMVTRYMAGDVMLNYGKENDFSQFMGKFKALSQTLKDAGLKEFIEVDEIFEENKTCYFSFSEIHGVKVLDYQQGRPIGYQEAFNMLKPFVDSLITAFNKGLFFRADINEMVVATGGNLALNSVFKFEYTPQYVMEDIANIFYTLITGKQYVQTLVRPSEAGAQVPERLDVFLYEVLYANPPFGSIEEFYRFLSEVVNSAEMAPPPQNTVTPPQEPIGSPTGTYTPPQAGEYIPPTPSPGFNQGQPVQGAYTNPYQQPKKSNTGKVVAGCAGVGCLFLILIPILLFAVGRSAVNNLSEIDYFEDTVGVTDWDEEYLYDEDYDYSVYYMYETYTYCSLYDYEVVFNDSITEDAENVYYRSYEDRWMLVKQNKATGDRTVMAEDVLPAFMSVYEGMLFYSDGLDDYHIHAMDVNTHESYEILEVRSGYVTPYNGRIYFSNLEDWCSLYSANMDGSDVMKLTKYEAEYINALDGMVYYMDTDGDYNIRAFNTSDMSDKLVDTESVDNLITRNGKLYYIDYETSNIKELSPDGEERIFDTNAYVFDIYGETIYYADNDDLFLHAYNMETGEDIQLSEEVDLLYLKIAGGTLYGYLYEDETLIAYDLNTGEYEQIFDEMPDYDYFY